jgi:hypothetical protein
MQRRITERFYELRLTHYPKAFELTEPLLGTKLFSKNITTSEIDTVLNGVNAWKATQATFIMSHKARESFFQLRECISDALSWKEPFSEDQLRTIWESKNNFRLKLREDISLLFDEDK